MTSVSTQVTRGSTWELARRELPSRLRPFVRSWLGYAERAPGLARHRELPGSAIVVIFEFGPPLRVSASGGEVCLARGPGGFVAGLDDRPTMTEHDGEQAGIQVDLTPLGARALFRVPLRELSRRVVALPDLSIGGLSERLAAASSWAERFTMVERLLCSRIAAAKPGSAPVRWALAQIDQSGGRVRIDELAAAIGCSRKHLVALFHDHVGLAPKRYASLVRFNQLVSRLVVGGASDPSPDWPQLALALGFADQAHLAREVKRFAGVSPTQLRRSLEGQVTFVQDQGPSSE